MVIRPEVTTNAAAARAVGRCYGALFFGVFGGAWLMLAAYALGRLSAPTLSVIVAAMVLLVGLHFFPMPPLYRHRANLVAGACMGLWAILCPVLFRGDRIVGFAAAGAGLALWTAAASALSTARSLLKAARL